MWETQSRAPFPTSGSGRKLSFQANKGSGGGDFGGRESRVYIPVLPVTHDSHEHVASLSLSSIIVQRGELW